MSSTSANPAHTPSPAHDGLVIAAACEGRRGVTGVAVADTALGLVRLFTFSDPGAARSLPLLHALSPSQVLLVDTHVAKGSMLTRRIVGSAGEYECVEIARRFWQESRGAELVASLGQGDSAGADNAVVSTSLSSASLSTSALEGGKFYLALAAVAALSSYVEAAHAYSLLPGRVTVKLESLEDSLCVCLLPPLLLLLLLLLLSPLCSIFHSSFCSLSPFCTPLNLLFPAPA